MYTTLVLVATMLILYYLAVKFFKNKKTFNQNKIYMLADQYAIFEYIKEIMDCHFNRNLAKTDKYEYYATMVHDLKTPVYAQIQTMQMLLNGYFGNLTSEQEKIIRETLQSEKYLADIISTILSVYKYDSGKFIYHKNYFDIAALLNDVYESVKFLAYDKTQNIHINYKCESLKAYGDSFQIKRVMTNFLSNAIKYGKPNTDIDVELKNANEEINFSVKNVSNPIPAWKLKKIFEKFSGDSSQYSGASTGLGLYLSKQIIRQHGGEVYAQSNSDGICTFGFRLRSKSNIEKTMLKK